MAHYSDWNGDQGWGQDTTPSSSLWGDSGSSFDSEFGASRPSSPGGEPMIATAAAIGIPLAYNAIAGYLSQRSQGRQRDLSREEWNKQWEADQARLDAMHEESIRQWELTEWRKEAQWDAMQSQHEADWINTTELKAPYRAASRAILGYVMPGLNVPDYNPINPYQEWSS